MAERKIRVAVLVSGGGTNLQAILDAQDCGAIRSGEVVLVVSDRAGAYALERAEHHGIRKRQVLRREHPDDFDRALLDVMIEEQIELIVLAGFLSILSPAFTERYDRRILNVHPSLIPSFCGAGYYGLRVHEAALQKGVKVTGATVHYVNEIPDGGEIIAQKAVSVHEGDTPETLQRRVMEEAEWVLLPEAVEKVCATLLSHG